MRTYACHRLYVKTDYMLKLASISMDENGTVSCFAPLTEETRATEWIGGVVFLSERSTLSSTRDFDALLKQNLCVSDSSEPRYAWHISHYDFQHECLTSQSVIQRL